uniref:Uncharacterized protein n=1 Tax=Anguilla anguilla TaxID=7936 RepID=A0A0E9V0E4_ANGAN
MSLSLSFLPQSQERITIELSHSSCNPCSVGSKRILHGNLGGGY